MVLPVTKLLNSDPKFTQTAKSNLENKDSKTGVLNLQGCKEIKIKLIKFKRKIIINI